jgi:isopenicillin N synthase-like dioxygenase
MRKELFALGREVRMRNSVPTPPTLHQAAWSSQFFELKEEEKNLINMKNSKVFRGWFALGDELTDGRRG